jgi:hypothetical protein
MHILRKLFYHLPDGCVPGNGWGHLHCLPRRLHDLPTLYALLQSQRHHRWRRTGGAHCLAVLISKLLKNAHLRRFPCQQAGPSSLRRTTKYASLLRISGAYHLGIFEQPEKNYFFSKQLDSLALSLETVVHLGMWANRGFREISNGDLRDNRAHRGCFAPYCSGSE